MISSVITCRRMRLGFLTAIKPYGSQQIKDLSGKNTPLCYITQNSNESVLYDAFFMQLLIKLIIINANANLRNIIKEPI